MRIVAWLSAVILLSAWSPASARAQAFELGASVAWSCTSIEYSFCTYNWGRADAVHGNWWITPELVVELRAARLDGPPTRIVSVEERISDTRQFFRSYTVRDERRAALQASVLYHFKAGRSIRPFIGGGTGALWWRGSAFCAAGQVECERVLPGGAPGPLEAREWIISFAGGLAVEPGGGTVIRGGLRDTTVASALWRRSGRGNPGAQLPEYFLSVGYRW